jgi:hypothetical protein
VPYFVLISAIIHLVAVKSDPSNANVKKKLLQGNSDLEEMAKCHAFALQAIDTLRYLAHIWDVDFSFTTSNRDLTDFDRLSTVSPDQFTPDVSILQTLQSIQPVLSSKDHLLFYPFPIQGLPSVATGTQLEQGGFTVVSKDGRKSMEVRSLS